MSEIAPLIQFSEVHYRYPYVREGEESPEVLSKLNVTIEAGTFVAILGANGSGKSTMAKHMNALLLPTRGQVTVTGLETQLPENAVPIRRQVGMVFQNPDNQIVATLVEEDVAFGPENLGLSTEEIHQRVEAALRSVGMWDQRTRAPHILSGGQKQRTAIAGVIAMYPKLIVFDEATAMLDPLGRQEVMDSIATLKSEGISIVLITHHMNEAMQADRVLLLHEGCIVADGTPREVFSMSALLEQCRLDMPPVARLAQQLNTEGLLPRADILSVDEMVEEICRLKSIT